LLTISIVAYITYAYLVGLKLSNNVKGGSRDEEGGGETGKGGGDGKGDREVWMWGRDDGDALTSVWLLK
jgi:hypothetical protein